MLNCWFFIIDIIIAVIGLFFEIQIADGVSIGSLLLVVAIISIIIKILLFVGNSRGE